MSDFDDCDCPSHRDQDGNITYPSIQSRLKSAEDKIERMKGLLKELEWIGITHGSDPCYCPSCGRLQVLGHTPDCKLWKEIQEGK